MRETSSRRCWRFSLCVAVGMTTVAFATIALAQPSAGDIAQAREFLNQGLDLRSHGDANGALEKLKAAHALAHTPITGLELGKTYVAVGKLVEARETFLSIGRIPTQAEETVRSKSARSESERLAEQLRSRIPSLTVRITGVAAESVAVTIDDANVPTEALAAPRFVDPGSHEVFARSTSGGTAETRVDLAEGEARDVELKITFTGGQPSAPTPPTAPQPSPVAPAPSELPAGKPSEPRPRLLEWSLIGGGAGVGLAGVILMVVEAAKASDANQNHDAARYDSALSAWKVGFVGSLVGAAAVACGGIVFAASGSSAGGHASQPPVWLAVGADDLRVGGHW